MKPNYTDRQIFTTEEEKEMIEYIDDWNMTYYITDLFEFLEKVYFTTVHNKKEIPQKWKETKRVGG